MGWLLLKAHDQRVIAEANSKRVADSLAVALVAVNELVDSNRAMHGQVERLDREVKREQAASARRQAEQEVKTNELLAQLANQVPADVRPIVNQLNIGFERERIDFRKQIADGARLIASQQNALREDTLLIVDLRRQLQTANEGWQSSERRGRGVVRNIAGFAIKGLAVYGAVKLTDELFGNPNR